MDAKICDRCGVYYRPKTASPIYKKVNPLTVAGEPHFEEIDLCPACKESFKSWMSFYEGTKKPNQDDPWAKMNKSK